MFYRTGTGTNYNDLSLMFIFNVRVKEEVNMGLQATNAGIDFQQRVSAYMMILMEFDMDISLALQVNKSNTIKEINFEYQSDRFVDTYRELFDRYNFFINVYSLLRRQGYI